MGDIALGLAPFVKRPPTPPREHNSTKLSNDNVFIQNVVNRTFLDTPDESPSSSAEYFRGSSEKARKKVGFSGWTQYHRPVGNGLEGPIPENQRRHSPPSRDCKFPKSILKPYNDNVTPQPGDELQAFDQSSLPAMLRSAAQHLASPSRSSRLDAYSTLLACLSAYDDVPDPEALAEKVVEISGYVRRDVCAKNEGDELVDTQLAAQALKLFTVFVCTPTMAYKLPEEMCSFIIERSLSTIEDERSAKILVSHYMYLLEKQKFSVKIMTTEKVKRLLSALDGVTTRVKGSRVVGHRLMIYHRLITQARPLMISRVSNWIDHLISGMSSTIKDIRARAIAFGTDAGLYLGTSSTVAQACIDVFNRASPEGKKVVDFLSARLIEMMGSKEDGVHVPQIWSIVILFLRNRRRGLEYWEHLKSWLVILQRCFNSSDAQIKFQASIAWNRLIYAINIDTRTSSSMAKMLRQPIVSQLERKSNEKNAKMAKQIARSSYCTLLYYALRPGSTNAQLDHFWDLYVSQVVPTCFTASCSEIDHACEILAALFSGSAQLKIWDENRANLSGPIKPAELPCLDPKWLRGKTASIIEMLDNLSQLAEWQANRNGEAPIVSLWRSFVSALGNASSKEVKASIETMSAVAHIVSQSKRFLDRIKQEVPMSGELDGADGFKKVDILVTEAVAKIGTLPFSEKRLLLTPLNTFEAAAETPSSGRSTRNIGTYDSPAAHILTLLLSSIHDVGPPPTYIQVLKKVISIPLQSGNSRRARLGVIRDLARPLSADYDTLPSQNKSALLRLLVEAVKSALELPQQSKHHSASPQYAGHDYREAVKMLEVVLHERAFTDFPTWRDLHTFIAETLDKEIGNAGVILMISEPLADTLIREAAKQCDDFIVNAAAQLVESIQWPRSKQTMEYAQKLLWGVVQVPHKSASSDHFGHLYSMINNVLHSAYMSLDSLSSVSVLRFLSALTSMLQRCPPESSGIVLERMQRGLGSWIEDAKEALWVSNVHENLSTPFSEVVKLSSFVWEVVERGPQFDSALLKSLQDLLASSLRSRHKAILNKSIPLWNRSFGSATSLEYPAQLRTTLLKLKSVTDIALPGLPHEDTDEIMSPPVRFIESQDNEDAEVMARPTATPRVDLHSKRLAISPSLGAISDLKSPLRSARKIDKTTPKARLRHDDSQIQFAAIESSPLVPEYIESQMLTDRQKEVKERQSREAAIMFPKISTSPRNTLQSARYTLPKLALKPYAADIAFNADDTSPTFPPVDTMMNDFLGSSPTPSSGKKKPKEPYSDDGHPSSSHFVSSHLQLNPGMGLVEHQDHDQGDQDQLRVQQLRDGVWHEEQQHVEVGSTGNNAEDAKEISDTLQVLPQKTHPNAYMLSDQDVFVDAPSEPQEDPPAFADDGHDKLNVAQPQVDTDLEEEPAPPGTVMQAPESMLAADPPSQIHIAPAASPGDDVSAVMDSFQSQKSSHFSAEDDQVAAQLINEMVFASSQKSRGTQGNKPPTTNSNKKRKRSSEPILRKRAKAAATATGYDLQGNTEPTLASSGETAADCVMIDVRPANIDAQLPVPRIKREQSPSPSVTQAMIERPTLEAQIYRSAKTPRRRQPLSQDTSSVGQNTHKAPIKEEHELDGGRSKQMPSKHRRRSSRLSGATTESGISCAVSPGADDVIDGPMIQAEPAQTSRIQSGTQDSVRQAPAVSHQAQELQIAPTQYTAAPASEHSDTEVPGATPRGILQSLRNNLKNMIDNIKQVGLEPEEERAIIGVLFESVHQVHEAGRRSSATEGI